MIKVGIIGATGYAGAEIVRLIMGHPEAEVVWYGSRSYIDEKYSSIFGNFFKMVNAKCLDDNMDALAKEVDAIFTATPQGLCASLVNEEILDEYYEVLFRNKFGFDESEIKELINRIKDKSIILEREQTLEDFVDEDDIVFYEIVMSARNTMDAYLITGNIKHYPIRNYVVTPKEMLDIIENDKRK